MKIRKAIVSIALGGLVIASPAMSEDIAFEILESHMVCARIVTEPDKRLGCFDKMTTRVGEWANATPLCVVEAFRFTPRGSNLYLTGAMSCADGKLIYRLYSEDEFLSSGEIQFSGYAFQTYTEIPNGQTNIEMRFVVH